MLWNNLVEQVRDYGFLGPIVGIAGLFTSAATVLLFTFTKSINVFKPPPDVLVGALVRVVILLCGVGIFLAWFLAEPSNGFKYLRAAIWLAVVCVLSFLAYIYLRSYCGRFRRPTVDRNNNPGPDEVIWGGFWLTPAAREAVIKRKTVEAFLAGNQYNLAAVWPPGSRALATILTALFLILVLVGGTSALSTMAAAAQVALTGKPTRAVFSSADVPGLPMNQSQHSPTPNK